MAIEKKTCLCGCGRKFYGTARRKFAKDYCRVKWNRKKNLKSKADKEEQYNTGVWINEKPSAIRSSN